MRHFGRETLLLRARYTTVVGWNNSPSIMILLHFYQQGVIIAAACVCVRVCVRAFYAHEPFISDTPDVSFAQVLYLSFIWNFPSLWSVYVFFLFSFFPFGCYGWSKVNSASWAPPLTIIFIDADVRAIGSAFRSSQAGSLLKTGWCNDPSQSPNHPSPHSHAILLLLRTYNR